MSRGRKKEGREPYKTKVFPETRETLDRLGEEAGVPPNHAIDALAALAATDDGVWKRTIHLLTQQVRKGDDA
jgi:hypothetical protein